MADMDRSQMPDDDASQPNFTDFHADNVEQNAQVQPELDSNKTHVTATQPDPNLDLELLPYGTQEALERTDQPPTTTAVAAGRHFSKPKVDSAPIDEGFIFGKASSATKTFTPMGPNTRPVTNEQATREKLVSQETRNDNKGSGGFREEHPEAPDTTTPGHTHQVSKPSQSRQEPSIEFPKPSDGVKEHQTVPASHPALVLTPVVQPNEENIIDLTKALSKPVGSASTSPDPGVETPLKVSERTSHSNSHERESNLPRKHAEQLKISKQHLSLLTSNRAALEQPQNQPAETKQSPRQGSPSREAPVAQRPIPVPSEVDRTPTKSHATADKIRKRKKTSKKPHFDHPPESEAHLVEGEDETTLESKDSSSSGPSQEDILNVLLYRIQKDKEKRDTEKAQSRARAVELSRMAKDHSRLQDDLEALQRQDEAQRNEIQNHKQALPRWQEKIEKLQTMVSGMGNDRRWMKDEIARMRSVNQQLTAERETIVKEIGDTTEAVGRFQAQCKATLEAMHQEILRAREAEESHRTSMQDHTELLDEERRRNDAIEDQLSRLLNIEQQAHSVNAKNVSLVSEKLENICSMPKQMDQDQLTEQFERLANLVGDSKSAIQGLQSRPILEQEHIQGIDSNVQKYAEKLLVAVDNNQQSTKSLDAEFRQMREELCSQLTSLTCQMKTEQLLSSQLADLKAEKAATDQMLKESQVHLQISSSSFSILENTKQQIEEKLASTLQEVQQLRSRPLQDPSLLSRIKDLETCNSQLEREVSQGRVMIDSQRIALEKNDTDSTQLQTQIETIQSQLECSEARCSKLQAQQTDFDQKVELNVEEIRKQLVEAADADKAQMQSRFMSALHDARTKSSALEAKAIRLEQELANIKSTSTNQNTQLEKLSQELETVQAQCQKQTESARRHSVTIDQLHKDEIESEESHRKEIKQLQQEEAENMRRHGGAMHIQRQQIKAIEAQINRSMDLAEHRICVLECGAGNCQEVIGHIMPRDIVSAVQQLIQKETEVKDDFIATQEALIKEMNSRQVNDDHESIDIIQTQQNETKQNKHPTEESQELPYGGESIRPVGKEESQELPYNGNRSVPATRTQPSYIPMGGLMQGVDGLEIDDSIEDGGFNYGAVAGYGNGESQNLQYIVEESHHSRKVWQSGAPDSTLRPLTANSLNQLNPQAPASQTDGLERIAEATSPVGDTRGLFPPTPKPVGTPKSSSNGSQTYSSAPRANTSKVLNGTAEHEGAIDFKTPNRPLQPQDTNRMLSAMSISPENGNHNNTRSAPVWLPKKGPKAGNKAQFGSHSNKIKSEIASQENGLMKPPPKAISKPVTQNQADLSEKRESMGAGSSNTSRSRKRKMETEDLGPTIGSTSSPGMGYSKSKTGQARKSLRRKSQDKFQRRFQDGDAA